MTLDFLVIGAQKGGTTSLWQYLRSHPRLCMPGSKEAPLFTRRELDPGSIRLYMETLFAGAPKGSRLGTVTPDYMIGQGDVSVEIVAERIASAFPDVKLITLLRDPVERALSSYMMAVRRGQEKRSPDAALHELLGAEMLTHTRLHPSHTNSYVAGGEYGRILATYRAHFRDDQLLVLSTEDLAEDPGQVVDAVLGHLELPAGFRPEGLGVRHFRGGTRRLLDPESERLLRKFFAEELLPNLSGREVLHRAAFNFFLETWNVVPAERPPQISAETREALESHFRHDATRLVELGVRAPWLDRWK